MTWDVIFQNATYNDAHSLTAIMTYMTPCSPLNKRINVAPLQALPVKRSVPLPLRIIYTISPTTYG